MQAERRAKKKPPASPSVERQTAGPSSCHSPKLSGKGEKKSSHTLAHTILIPIVPIPAARPVRSVADKCKQSFPGVRLEYIRFPGAANEATCQTAFPLLPPPPHGNNGLSSGDTPDCHGIARPCTLILIELRRGDGFSALKGFRTRHAGQDIVPRQISDNSGRLYLPLFQSGGLCSPLGGEHR